MITKEQNARLYTLPWWSEYVEDDGRITKEMCIAELKRVAKQLGHTPTQNGFNKHSNISYMTVVNLLGTWNKGLQSAGLEINESKTKITKIKVLAEIRRVTKLLGHTPKAKEFHKHASMSYLSVVYRFGSWNKGLQAAGLVLLRAVGITKEMCIAELLRVEKQLGRTPTVYEFRKHASMHDGTVANLFGTWNKGVRAAGLTPNNRWSRRKK